MKRFWMSVGVLVWLGVSGAQAADSRPVEFETHDGYFVSNKFEPDAPASFVVLQEQKAFDDVFGAGFVMRDRHHRLPKDAFDTKMVVAAIKRGNAKWTYRVESLTADAGVLTLKYSTRSEAQPTAQFACPLIVSLAKGKYAAVEFVEDGKPVRKIDLEGARGEKPANATEVFLGAADQWPRCAIELRDVQGLWGGTAIYLRGSGRCVVRIVPGGQEKRYTLELKPEETLALRNSCIEADLVTVMFRERIGAPDEGKPVIVLRNADGKTHEMCKWANDKVAGFDPVYQALLGLKKKTEGLKPEYQGPFQRDWRP